MINSMILEAHREGASDIHIESYPGHEKTRIRFRRDGQLYTYLELPPSYRNAIVARIKIMCDLDISEKRKPQDGKINFAKYSPQHRIELRVATIPTSQRPGRRGDAHPGVGQAHRDEPLGLSPRNLAQLTKAVERPYGMVLCVGPTGSGKTTTLHSALMHINTPERKIWTAEDPIEITQAGLRQVQVNPRIDWTFAKALRAFVRADPDVIMVGEIRDEETAKTAIEASLTGHLVLSTLHTNSAPETVTRLLDMGMDPFNFADSLLAVLAQRLVRRLCTQLHHQLARDTGEDRGTAGRLHARLRRGGHAGRARGGARRLDRTLRPRRPAAQPHQHRLPALRQHGLQGPRGHPRADGHVQDACAAWCRPARAPKSCRQAALREGMRTLRQDGIEKVLAGQTTIEEVRATSNV
jgi:type II secretory ATPase GspE/PulE/Tfp pilus assembly ATPase PilB-like protein